MDINFGDFDTPSFAPFTYPVLLQRREDDGESIASETASIHSARECTVPSEPPEAAAVHQPTVEDVEDDEDEYATAPPMPITSPPPPPEHEHYVPTPLTQEEELQRTISLSKRTAQQEDENRRAASHQPLVSPLPTSSSPTVSPFETGRPRSVQLSDEPGPIDDFSALRPPAPRPTVHKSQRAEFHPPLQMHPRDLYRADLSKGPAPVAAHQYAYSGPSSLDFTPPTPSRNPSNVYHPARFPEGQPTTGPPHPPPPKISIPESGRARRQSNSTIRDGSRTRGTSQMSGEMCDYCKEVGLNRWYCNVCAYTFCDRCWDAQMPHRDGRLAMGTIPHEKTPTSIAKKVQDVLTPGLTEEQCEELHTRDIDTTWFGVVREEAELPFPLFRDYGRYANLMAECKETRLDSIATLSATSDHGEILYPSLVSFVGETGAGKSTLIKLLIDLRSHTDDQFATPVVGAAGRDVATSEDVHLYIDPDSSESQAPILFADCEGLDGGEREPVGARLKRKLEKQAAAASSGPRRRRLLKHTSERELTWADTARKRSREFAVAHLYPRLLYTFSDVIVFVLKNPKRIESVLQRLVEWAAAALEKSSNQPVLPHAIIALNASENDIAEELWDVKKATASLMENLAKTVFQNATFKKMAQFWRERRRQIDTVEQLLLSYYSSVSVVRIPTIGRPRLISAQVEKLSDAIRLASKASRDNKWDLRMLLDADEFQPYLQVAFDHFAETLDEPFDFVQASFTYSPIPNDFGGNVLKLAIQVMECWKDLAKGNFIFEEIGFLVASCITLDAARNKNKGAVESIFPQYLDHIDAALENFCDRHWPCEFVGRGGRCVNVRSGHGAKGHQLKTGKLLADGEYQSSFTPESHGVKFRDDVYHKLVALREKVRSHQELNTSEDEAAAEVHRDLVLPAFLEHASHGDETAFISHTVCFCCLFQPPEHALPCGHIICSRCLNTYGKAHFNGTYVEITQCPMEKPERRFRQAWKVSLKPVNCGSRILTLDGGGVRGIVELEVLRLIEKELGGKLHIQGFFDLIVGTSTGGLIALGLTARNWTVEECTTKFEHLIKQAFTKRNLVDLPGLGWLIKEYNHSKYETQPLQDALIEAFSEDQYLFGGKRSDPGTLDLKVAVTATSAAGKSVLLTNYNRLCTERLSYDFQRPEKVLAELKTWEAARATSAAPTYFKPLCHEPSKMVLSDGGIFHNNPVHIADRERRLIWPAQQDSEPDIVVSIGTSYTEAKLKRQNNFTAATTGIFSQQRYKMRLARDVMASTSDCERTWREYLDTRRPRAPDKARYVRLNPELRSSPPKLDEVDRMKGLQELTRLHMADTTVMRALARRLVATSFYFDPQGGVKEDPTTEVFEVTGFIHCRFMAGMEVTELGTFIKTKANAGHPAHFLIREENAEDVTPQELIFDSRIISRMVRNQVFRMDKVSIRLTNRLARTEIFLCFNKDETETYPISGFPRCLHSDPPTVATTRQNLTAQHSFRWAGRSSSQQQRRRDWQPPSGPKPFENKDIFAQYLTANHLLGNATEADLTGFEASLQHVDSRDSDITSDTLETPVELPTVEDNTDAYFVASADWSATWLRAGADRGQYLGVRRGDLVKITLMGREDWWLGRLAHNPKEGWVPPYVLTPADEDAAVKFRSMMDTGSDIVYLTAELPS